MDQDTKRNSSPGGLSWVILVAFAPVLYLLSFGPVGALAAKGPPSALNTLRAFYSPWMWLYKHTPLKRPLKAYLRLWGSHSGPSGNACVDTLRQLDRDTQRWALENRKTTNDVPTWGDLGPYLSRRGRIPTCPSGGTYTLGRLNKPPVCTISTHNVTMTPDPAAPATAR
jgi:hypothetical protein